MGALTGTGLALLIGGTALKAGGDVASGVMQGNAARDKAEYDAKLADRNAAMEEEAAADAIRRGDKEAGKIRTQGRQVVGAQRAAMAVQGLDVDSGSAQDLQEDTIRITQEDAETTRTNSWKAAFGHKVQAQNYRESARFGRASGEAQQRNSILMGGMRAAGSLADGAMTAYRKG